MRDVLPVPIHPATAMGPVHLAVGDLERSVRFYEDVLGLRTASRANASAALAAGPEAPGEVLVRLTEVPGARPQPRRTIGLYHFAILMPTRAALARSLRRLIETRYRLHGASDHLVSEALYLDDPDGNGIELYADRPRERWARTSGGVAMATDPLNLDDLLAEVRSEASNQPFALDPSTRIGHVHLHVSSLEQAEAFYHRVLGFEVTQRDYPGALFLAAGDYHHHIGANIWAGAGAPRPPAGSAGLREFTIVLPDETELQTVVARLRIGGAEPVRTQEGWRVPDPSSGVDLLLAAAIPAPSRQSPTSSVAETF
ncbi:MAG: VOC family protein [Armatimonadota bacterium]